MNEYDITYQGRPVGRARVEKKGLYCLFSCRCHLPAEGLYRIVACVGESALNLGICVPLEDQFGMDKKTAAKYLAEGELSFVLLPSDEPWEKLPTPVHPEEPVQPEEPEEQLFGKTEENPPVAVEECFVPVSEEEPFEHLQELEHARLEVRGDTVGILLEE